MLSASQEMEFAEPHRLQFIQMPSLIGVRGRARDSDGKPSPAEDAERSKNIQVLADTGSPTTDDGYLFNKHQLLWI